MTTVFTYGTLQIPEVVTGRAFASIPAVLENYARYRWDFEPFKTRSLTRFLNRCRGLEKVPSPLAGRRV